MLYSPWCGSGWVPSCLIIDKERNRSFGERVYWGEELQRAIVVREGEEKKKESKRGRGEEEDQLLYDSRNLCIWTSLRPWKGIIQKQKTCGRNKDVVVGLKPKDTWSWNVRNKRMKSCVPGRCRAENSKAPPDAASTEGPLHYKEIVADNVVGRRH